MLKRTLFVVILALVFVLPVLSKEVFAEPGEPGDPEALWLNAATIKYDGRNFVARISPTPQQGQAAPPPDQAPLLMYFNESSCIYIDGQGTVGLSSQDGKIIDPEDFKAYVDSMLDSDLPRSLRIGSYNDVSNICGATQDAVSTITAQGVENSRTLYGYGAREINGNTISGLVDVFQLSRNETVLSPDVDSDTHEVYIGGFSQTSDSAASDSDPATWSNGEEYESFISYCSDLRLSMSFNNGWVLTIPNKLVNCGGGSSTQTVTATEVSGFVKLERDMVEVGPGIGESTRANWINVATIEYEGIPYIDPFHDADHIYYPEGNEAGASCWIEVDRRGNDINFGSGDGLKLAEFADNATAEYKCSSADTAGKQLTLDQKENARIWYVTPDQESDLLSVWSGGVSDGGGLYTGIFPLAPAYNADLDWEKDVNCVNKSSYINETGVNTYEWRIVWRGDDCGNDKTVTMSGLVLADITAYTAVQANISRVAAGVDGELAEPDVSCENNSGPLGWLACGLIEALERGTSWFYGIVQSELHLFTDASGNEVDNLLTENSGDLEGLWRGFRNIARLLLVIVVLFIIYSEVIGSGITEAYNVKRMLPRFALAIIGIELSWVLFKEFAVIIENIGQDLPDLIYSAWGGAPSFALKIDAGLGAVSTFGGGFYATFAIASGAIWGLLPVAIGVLIAVFVAFIVLVLRRMILVALLVLSPIALVLWVLPGTDEWFKRWFGTYRNLLLMYPIIQLLVAFGVLMSQVGGSFTVDATAGGQLPFAATIRQLIAVVAFFAPYFMIPLTFKWAGGVFANVAGMVNDRSRGVLDRSRQYAQERRDFGRTKRAQNIDPNEGLRKRAWKRMRAGMAPVGMRDVPGRAGEKFGELGALKERQTVAGARKTFGEIDAFKVGQDTDRLRAMTKEQAIDEYGETLLTTKGIIDSKSGEFNSDKLAIEHLSAVLNNKDLTGNDKKSSFGDKDAAGQLLINTLANNGVQGFRKWSEQVKDSGSAEQRQDLQRIVGANAGVLKSKAFDVLAGPDAVGELEGETLATQAKSTHVRHAQSVVSTDNRGQGKSEGMAKDYLLSLSRMLDNDDAFESVNVSDFKSYVDTARQQFSDGGLSQSAEVQSALNTLAASAAARHIDVNATLPPPTAPQVQGPPRPPTSPGGSWTPPAGP